LISPDTLVIITSAKASSWLPTAAALIAALAAVISAAYGPIAQRRLAASQRLSELRRAWIADLRSAVAEYMTSLTRIRGLMLHEPFDQKAATDELNEASRQVALIRMMLDRSKPKHHELSDALTAALAMLTPTRRDLGEYGAVMARLDNAALDLLDEAWERVKKGD
jgi:hypothetical protein